MSLNLEWLAPQFPLLSDLRNLGSGGQKWVFSATHSKHGDVVLKLIKPGTAVDVVEREIAAVQRVNSPRVPMILEVGMLQSPLGHCLWITEKRVIGTTLSDQLRLGPISSTRVLRLGLHALQALAHAERASIVHRDVKPANMMMDKLNGFWLLDFGLARHLTLESLTPSADAFGKCTPGYAPPEQFRNSKRDIDSRTDLFALGVTLYECLTGVNPYVQGARDILDILKRVERIPLPPLQLTGFTSAADFCDLIASLTQRRRDHRPRNAQTALDWMNNICACEGID